ncbi:hypothetical protein LR48_Vigan17s000800 [Vigna angularis]|uniref:Putative plant transposon protein domain-containing protein n=1 Tax=Phaseolus angularis TaxID=3914 RepID=A0A0L9T2W5_PHAAN|nr:hypothetical protein LR48_Vigan17s000800 [Vigna angularis]
MDHAVLPLNGKIPLSAILSGLGPNFMANQFPYRQGNFNQGFKPHPSIGQGQNGQAGQYGQFNKQQQQPTLWQQFSAFPATVNISYTLVCLGETLYLVRNAEKPTRTQKTCDRVALSGKIPLSGTFQDREERVVVDVFKDERQTKDEEASYKVAFQDAHMTSHQDEEPKVKGMASSSGKRLKTMATKRKEKEPEQPWSSRFLSRKHEKHFKEKLATYPAPANIAVVKEFYTNAKKIGDYPAENYLSYVRGHAIRYDPDSINNFLDTMWAGEQCQFALCMEEGADFEDVERVLCIPRGHFQRNRFGSVVNIRRIDLTPLAKYWMSFSHANIQPCSHVSDITLSRAFLIYCAIRNLNVNIGQVIADEISVCANTSNNKAPLGHPSLITHLCKIAGVDTSAPPFERPRKAIDEAYYRQYCGGEEAA